MNISTYKKVLSKYATGITIVTKKNKNDFITGITVNSFVSISLKPAYISWSLDKTTSSFKKFNNLKFFNIYILSSKQTNVSNYFSSKGLISSRNISKFISYMAPCIEVVGYRQRKKGITSFGDLCSDFGANVKFLIGQKKKYKKKSLL